MKRRSFFSRIAGFVAAVAIAPEIAFRSKLPLPGAAHLQLESVQVAFWTQDARYSRCVDPEYEKLLRNLESRPTSALNVPNMFDFLKEHTKA